ncbi:MAG: hypothetical protein KDD40_07720, partial [Bdellovibrionales bacterium]|nr:hypothetical protein [Bdellovibrionales bacterium]
MNGTKYQLICTADGSPSLHWLDSGEAMHNRQGALSESLAIYGECIKESILKNKHAHILSIGLGLAYNEIITSALCLLLKPKEIYIESFEAEDTLRESLLDWLTGKTCQLFASYDYI